MLRKLLERLKVPPMNRTALLIITVIGAILTAAPTRAQVNIEQIVAQKVQPILPERQARGVAPGCS